MKQYRGKENPQSKGHITITPLKSLAAKIYDGNIHLIRKENALRFFILHRIPTKTMLIQSYTVQTKIVIIFSSKEN